MKKIAILVDNSLRDLLPSRLLQEEFNKKGFKAYLFNKRNIIPFLLYLEPDACIFSRGDYPNLEEIGRSCKLFIVPSEGGRLTAETMKSVFYGRMHEGIKVDMNGKKMETNFDHISKVYLWGKTTYDFLLSGSLFNKNQLKTVGNGRMDVYLNSYSAKKKTIDKVVGIAISIKSLSVYYGQYSWIKRMYDRFSAREASQFPMVPVGRDYEDFVWRDLYIARKAVESILVILRTTNHKIHIRVGPFENPKDYLFLQKKYPNRIIIRPRSESMYEFIDGIDTMLTCWSTSGLESIVMGIPVVSIAFLGDYDHLISHVDERANGFDTFLKIYHTPKSLDQLIDLVNLGVEGKLKSSKDVEFSNNFMKAAYNYPSDITATTAIVEDIVGEFSNYVANPKAMRENLSIDNKVLKFLNRYTLIFHKEVFYLINKMYLLKYFIKDLFSGSYYSNKMHYALQNKNIDRFIMRHFKK
jgi:surface carbohydrate biosynthesis protein